MTDYLENVALITDLDNDKSEDHNRVTIMTIHAAKGLEFNNVYIVGVEEELFPSRMSFESPEDLEEERRLFYVALTRAKKRVYISYANNRYRWGTPTACQPSRFLRDIDSKFLELPAEPVTKTPLQDYDDEKWDHEFYNKSKYESTPLTRKPVITGASKPFVAPRKPAAISRPANESFTPDNPEQIQSGMRVEHATFGIGKILRIEGVAPNRKASVFFQEINEEKQLLLKFAKLRIVKGDA
jgi:DNA helicase-2/ATP-dependent DNA helicase PcrA